MASYNEEFNQYRIFLENLSKSPAYLGIHPKAARILRHRIVRSHIDGEVIYWMLNYLDEYKCPTKLVAPIIRNVLRAILDDYNMTWITASYGEKKSKTIVILEQFCLLLLDNVKLNNILHTATPHSRKQQGNDDLLTIPIRTAATMQNKRPKMEDRIICVDEFHKVYDIKDGPTSSFYAVFDGHGGYIAAEFTASQLAYILSKDELVSRIPTTALFNAFRRTDEKFLSNNVSSGTTAICALYRPEEARLLIAWVGDSSAMLAKQHGKITQLSSIHSANNPQEAERIRSLGGSIRKSGGVLRVNGLLSVTRAIGDIDWKKLVIGEPDCVLLELDKQEEFLVIATDGLWDHVNKIDVAKVVYDCIKEDSENLEQIPDRLIKLALEHNSSDNISVIVVFFKQPSLIAKNCDNLDIMESQFDNIKEVDYYNSSKFYPENTTSNSHAIDSLQLRWKPNDDLNNIINEEVEQTTATTTSTTTTTNNGQFDDNLLYSSDNIDLKEKSPSPAVDDNNLHHASTLENNGEELLLGAGYDNKNELSNQFDNNQEGILEKNLPHHQLGDADADYGPETCVDVTDDVVMMTENSADTNNLLEQSTLSHSKDTLPSSADNCNPFDNKNTLDMEDGNEFQLGGCGTEANLHLDDANKSTPLLSPEVEDLPLSSDGGLQFTNEGFQQSPMDDEIPIGSHQLHNEFEDEFMQSNGHLSPPIEVKTTEVEKQTEEQEDIESLAKLEKFGDLDEQKVNKELSNEEKLEGDIPQQQTDLDVDFLESPAQSPINKEKDNIFDNSANIDNDDSDFSLKDEKEISEKNVAPSLAEKEFKESDNELLDLNQRDELQQTLQNLEGDILEEKPILTGSITEKQVTEINFDDMSMQPEEEKLSDFAEEKQDREEFSEKEGKYQMLSFVVQEPKPSGEIELEEDECIHLEEDVRPTDYMAMLEKQSEEQEEMLKEVTGFDKQVQLETEESQIEGETVTELLQKPVVDEEERVSENSEFVVKKELYEDGDRLSEKVEQSETPLSEDDESVSDKVQQYTKELEQQKECEKDEGLSEKDEELEELCDLPEQLKDEKLTEQSEQLKDEELIAQPEYEQVIEQVEQIKDEKPTEQPEELKEEKLTEQPEQLKDDKLTNELEKEIECEKDEEPEELLSVPEQLKDEKLSEQPEQLLEEQHSEAGEKLPEQSEESVKEHQEEDEKQITDAAELEKEHQHEVDEKLDQQVEQIEKDEHYDMDESISVGTEQLEQERHLDDIEIMSQQFDRFEKEDQAEDRLKDQIETNVVQTELVNDVQLSEKIIEQSNDLQEELQTAEESQLDLLKDEILNEQTKQVTEDNKLESEIDSLVEAHSPVEDDSIAQPEKQCFEEPEKIPKMSEADIEKYELLMTPEEPKHIEELPIEEPENKPIDENVFEVIECPIERLAKIELQVLAAAPAPVTRSEPEKITFDDEDIDPDNLVEVVEEIIIKEQVPIKQLPVASQEPSIVPPTHESCDESEDDEWKYMKEGQGEKQLLGLQGDIVVEEELQQQLQEAGALFTDEKAQQPATTFIEQISSAASEQIESIKDTLESLTQNIVNLAESAAETPEQVEKIDLENPNLSQSSTREKLDNIEDEDLSASEMNSKLNPEAKEFVPTFSPTSVVDIANGFANAPTAIPPHFKDELLAQSPRKGRESNMENINIPAETEFDEEIANKPHELLRNEVLLDHAENGGLYQEMNWKEAMHGSEKEEGPLVDSPVTEESLEVVDNALQYGATPNLCDFSAPVDLDNAGMKESIYIENNTSVQSNEEDILNTVQVLPVDDAESKDSSFEGVAAPVIESLQDAVTNEEVQEILTLASDAKKENTIDEDIEQKMEQLLLSHDKEITKDVQLETEQVPINGIEMSPTTPEAKPIEQSTPAAGSVEVLEPLVEKAQESTASNELALSPVPVAEEAHEGLALGAAVAVAVAATATAAATAIAATTPTAAVKKTEAKKPIAGTTAKPAAKRTLADKSKPASTSTLASKPASTLASKKIVSSVTSVAPRPRTAPAVGVKTPTEKKSTTTTTASTAKSRIDTKPPTTLAARKPLTSSAAKAPSSKPASATSSKTALGSKTLVGSTKPTPSSNAITKPRPATASSVATTNGTVTKTAAAKPTSLAPKSAVKPSSTTSPRGTLTSTLRKTEAIKSPTKTTSSTITSRVNNSTNGTKTTTTTRTTTSKTSLSTVPTAAARSTGTTTTTTTRRSVTGTTSTIGATTPTSKTNNLVPRKSTPLKKTSSSTPSARKSIGSHLNASATKPTKDTTTPRPVTIPAHLQNNNNSNAAAASKDVPLVPIATSTLPTDEGQPKQNGIVSPDDVQSPTAPVAHPLEMEIA